MQIGNGFDADEARYNRNNRMNPPDFSPGMSGDDMNFFGDSSFSQPNTGGMDGFGSTGGMGGITPVNLGGDSSSPLGGSSLGGYNGGNFSSFGSLGGLSQPQSQQQQRNPEDAFWDAASKGAKGTANFMKDVVNSFKGVNAFFWQSYGATTLIICAVVFGTGLVLRLLGVEMGYSLLLGAVVAAIPSVLLLMFNTENAQQYKSKYNVPVGGDEPQAEGSFTDNNAFAGAGSDGFNMSDMNFDDNSSSGFDDFDSFDDVFDDLGDSEDDDEFADYDSTPTVTPSDGEDMESSLENMMVIEKGMYTRQYLYEMFTKVLPTLKPDFASEKEFTEDSDEFLYWEDKLREAAEVCGCNEDNLPDLLEMRENLFSITLVSSRSRGFKPQQTAEELGNIYANLENLESVATKVNLLGAKCVITIFTGKTALISLKDMYSQVEDFMLDSKNYIPVVLGVGTDGSVYAYDFKKLESVIITGMPRSGKSWFVQCVLYQMCSFVPPSELNIYICDPKEGISDFKAFSLPHVKRFVSGDDNIVKELRRVVKVEGPRRKKIIGDAGFVNIWDYKEMYPDVKLPVIYVLVDEVVTLASRMDKETNNEFRMLLRELISQLPALGIRAFLIPHVLNNDIIEKKTSDLVPCKVSVCGDADHIEKATGSKYRDFPYKLTQKGDMAVRMPALSANTLFIHAPALTDSNPKNNKLFDYARRVWGKLEPEECADSVAALAEEESANKDLLDKLEADDEDMDLF